MNRCPKKKSSSRPCGLFTTARYASLHDSEPVELAGRPLRPKAPATEAERLHARRKCLKCSAFYTEATNDRCRFHPGTFVDSGVTAGRTGGTFIGWTCCKYTGLKDLWGTPELNERATRPDCPGCTLAPLHEEDLAYSRFATQFPYIHQGLAAEGMIDDDSSSSSSSTGGDPCLYPSSPHVISHGAEDSDEEQILFATPGGPTTTTTTTTTTTPGAPAGQQQKKKKKGRKGDIKVTPELAEHWHVHKVTDTDTLSGIAIRYGVLAGSIRMANNLPSHINQIHHLPKLYIPISKEAGMRMAPPKTQPSKHHITRRMCIKTGLEPKEAQYYLADAEWDLHAAIALYEEDATWEAEQAATTGKATFAGWGTAVKVGK